jgi:hypothetical protein
MIDVVALVVGINVGWLLFLGGLLWVIRR